MAAHGAPQALLAAVALLCSLWAAAASGSRQLLQTEAPDGFPRPVAYFPLLDRNLTAAYSVGGKYTGVGHNLAWGEEDPVFGSVMECDRSRGSYVTIPGLSYGQGGDFAISFWTRMHLEDGSDMEYLYSHNSSRTSQAATGPNQIQLYVPERNHSSFGVVRTIVRDRSDSRVNGTLPTFLDSDGCVSDPGCPGADRNVTMFADNGTRTDWALVTLTTHPEGGRGFQLYVNGQLAAEMDEGARYIDSDGYTKAVNGGDPILLDGDVVLCGRADLDEQRFFNGHIAHLMVFNTSLAPDHVAFIYDAARSAPGSAQAVAAGSALPATADAATADPSTDPPAGSSTGSGSVAGTPATEYIPARECTSSCREVDGMVMCNTRAGELRLCTDPAAAQQAQQAQRSATAGGAGASQGLATKSRVATVPTPESRLPAAPPAAATGTVASTLGGLPLCSAFPIQGLNTLMTCPQGSSCMALSRQQLAANFGGMMGLELGTVGVCAYTPRTLMLPAAATVPPAMAFFPLSGQSLESFPLPDYKGVNRGATMEADPVFGSALRCQQDDSDLVALDPVQYARSGAFTVNFWFKPGNLTGSMLSYLFSHQEANTSSTPASNSGWGPNQVQMYMPQQSHPDFGIMRSIAKDNSDRQQGPGAMEYLDSDGSVSISGLRPLPGPLLDGGWHMATLSSQPTGGKGFRLYIDGQLAGEIEDGMTYLTSDGYVLQPNAGEPMLLTGNVVLCSRADANSQRHFDGKLAYLGLYDMALNETQVAALYSAVTVRADPKAPEHASAGSGAPQETVILSRTEPGEQPSDLPQRTSTSGRTCQFPALYNGALTYDCVNITGQPYCQVETDVWEPCASAPGSGSGSSATGAGNTTRYTMNGEECQFPATFPPTGQQVTDCVDYQGAIICQVTPGTWKQCAPLTSSGSSEPEPGSGADTREQGSGSSRAPITTVDGQTCRLPLTYKGSQVDNCVSIAGGLFCWGDQQETWAACPAGTASVQPTPGELGVDAASVNVMVVPAEERVTTDGVPCALPTVVEGEIIDDCVPRNGVPSCITPAGDWKACDLSRTSEESSTGGAVGEEEELLVANRTTVGVEACLLPAVARGYLWFDCIDYADSSGTTEVCPTRNGTWGVCARLSSANSTKQFSLDYTLNRTQPGRPGQLCDLGATTAQRVRGCTNGTTCFPLPDLGGNATEALIDAGFCSATPVGGTFGVYRTIAEQELPVPLAHFPLTGGSLASVLLPPYNGTTFGSEGGPAWVEDLKFGSVVHCNNSDDDALVLDNVPYGRGGDFAVNLWMRRLPGFNASGAGFQYIFSHGAVDALAGSGSNQVQIYVGDRDHPSYGLVRAIVRDSTDTTAALLFLDSDGQVNSNANRTEQWEKHADVNDGEWHMLTLSTLANSTPGYAMFVDGKEVGALTATTSSAATTALSPTGGDPVLINDYITLCARSDLEESRFFDGSVANLMLFSQALTPDQVSQLFQTYNSSVASTADAPLVQAAAGASDPEDAQLSATSADPGSGSGPSGSSSSSGGGGSNGGMIAGIVIAAVGGTLALAALMVLFVTHVRRKREGRFQPYQDDVDGGGPGLPPVSPTVIQLTHAGSSKLGKDLSMDLGPSSNGATGPAGNPFAAGAGGASFTRPSASLAGTEPAGAGDGASVGSRMTDDVEVDSGKRAMLGFRKKPTRILMPGSLDSAQEGGAAHP